MSRGGEGKKRVYFRWNTADKKKEWEGAGRESCYSVKAKAIRLHFPLITTTVLCTTRLLLSHKMPTLVLVVGK